MPQAHFSPMKHNQRCLALGGGRIEDLIHVVTESAGEVNGLYAPSGHRY